MKALSFTRLLSAALAAAAIAACGGAANLLPAPSSLFTFSGVVREQFGVQSPGIAGATVTITSGAQAGRQVTTGPDGIFTFAGVPKETVQILASAEGFEAATDTVSAEKQWTQVLLAPVMAIDERAFAPADRSATIAFTVARRGPVTLRLSSDQKYCEMSYISVFAAEVPNRFWVSVCPPGPLTVERTEIFDPGQYSVAVHMLRWGNQPQDKREVYLRYPR